jgi:hypothetical protein
VAGSAVVAECCGAVAAVRTERSVDAGHGRWPRVLRSALSAIVIEKFAKEDSLVFTGPLGKSGPGGAKVRLAKGDVTVTHGPVTQAGGVVIFPGRLRWARRASR